MLMLARRDFPPRLIVVPEFAPAQPSTRRALPLLETRPGRSFPPPFDSIEIAYAPAARQESCARMLRGRGYDFMLVACWPYLLGQALRESVAGAALNLHPSLLPAYRGADPIGDQFEARDYRFGVTLHELDAGFDTGDIVAQQALPAMDATPSRAEVERRCAEIGAGLFMQALATYPDWRRRAQTS